MSQKRRAVHNRASGRGRPRQTRSTPAYHCLDLLPPSRTGRRILVLVGDENDRADADQQADQPDDPARIALKLVRARSGGRSARGAGRGRRRDRGDNDRQGRKRYCRLLEYVHFILRRWTCPYRPTNERATVIDPRSKALHRGSRSEEHTPELQSLMSISYAVFCLKKTNPI